MLFAELLDFLVCFLFIYYYLSNYRSLSGHTSIKLCSVEYMALSAPVSIYSHFTVELCNSSSVNCLDQTLFIAAITYTLVTLQCLVFFLTKYIFIPLYQFRLFCYVYSKNAKKKKNLFSFQDEKNNNKKKQVNIFARHFFLSLTTISNLIAWHWYHQSRVTFPITPPPLLTHHSQWSL